MKQSDQVQSNKPISDTGLATKKPYEKPAVVFERPLEALAAVCSPSPGKATTPSPCTVQFS